MKKHYHGNPSGPHGREKALLKQQVEERSPSLCLILSITKCKQQDSWQKLFRNLTKLLQLYAHKSHSQKAQITRKMASHFPNRYNQ